MYSFYKMNYHSSVMMLYEIYSYIFSNKYIYSLQHTVYFPILGCIVIQM